MKLFLALILCGVSLVSFEARADRISTEVVPEVQATRLYRLNCGDIHVSNLNVFSDTDEFVGQEKDLTVSCYLIRHGAHWLLWDTGLPSGMKSEGKTSGPFNLSLKETIAEQLAKIDLTPDDITHVAVSHTHFDHVGNVNLFKNATLIIQEAELAFLQNHAEEAKKSHMDADSLSYFLGEEHSKQVRALQGDTDLFGDGTLRAITLPGHTPGHMGLIVHLKESGAFVLSGDQWHFNENRSVNGVPSFNYNRADTLASSDKLNTLIKNNNAKLIIQHEVKDIATLPAFPEFLE